MGSRQQRTTRSTALTEAPRPKSRGASVFVDSSLQMSDFYVRFGQRIKQAREQKGLTQEDLSRTVPIDRGYLSEVETGKRRVSLYLAYQIARALEQSLDDLLSKEPLDA